MLIDKSSAGDSPSGEVAEIRSVTELIAQIAGSRAAGRRWFRGQASSAWDLRPGVARKAQHLRQEMAMVKQFMRDAVNRSSLRPSDEWEWLALAQHYGLPTRLLDWSEHPLVGLYFACEDPVDGPTDGRLFELDPESLNQASFQSAPNILVLGQDKQLDAYLPSAPVGPKMAPLAVTAMRYFDRLTAQVGTFTVSQAGEDLVANEAVQSWIIPVAAKAGIIAELEDLNIMASTVYPDLGHLASHIREFYDR